MIDNKVLRYALLMGFGVLCALLIHVFFVVNSDLVMHLRTAVRIGPDLVYGVTTREMNPPLFYYLLKGPLFLSDLFHVAPELMTMIVWGLLFGWSVAACAPALEMLGLGHKYFMSFAVVFMAAFALSQTYQFGQKETLMGFLILPGLLQLSVRASRQGSLELFAYSKSEAVLVFIAAIGLMIKPHYCAVMFVPLAVILFSNRAYLWKLLPVLALITVVGLGYAADLWRTGWFAYYLQNKHTYSFYPFLLPVPFWWLTFVLTLITASCVFLFAYLMRPYGLTRFALVYSGVVVALFGGATAQVNGSPYHYIPYVYLMLVPFVMLGVFLVKSKTGKLHLSPTAWLFFAFFMFFVQTGFLFQLDQARAFIEHTVRYSWIKESARLASARSVAFIGALPIHFQILAGENHLEWGLRTPCLWNLPEATLLWENGGEDRQKAQKIFHDMGKDIARDLNDLKPDFLGGCQQERASYGLKSAIEYMMIDDDFKAAMANYHVFDKGTYCTLYVRN